MQRLRHDLWKALFPVAVLLLAPAFTHAQQLPTVNRGVEYLKGKMAARQGTGETALATLAMIKAEVPANDPAMVAALRVIDGRFSGSAYSPDRRGGPEIYEAGCLIMALANLDPNGRKAQISSIADYIIAKQKAAGGWDYDGRTAGDTSISQYAVLGLWEAENIGVNIHPRIWDSVAQFYMSTQSAQGSWTYHRDEGSGETLSMTAAGVGSLMICQKQLAAYRRVVSAQNPYLIPVLPENQQIKYSVKTPAADLARSINSGTTWLASNFTTTNDGVIGQSPFYCLYGIERVGALAGRANLGNVDWFDRGAAFINSKQQADGSFTSSHGEIPNTAWAVLFLTKSTAKTIERIKIRRLGAGELFGGKGLPKDLSQISEAGGRLVARPMDGAVEGMLTVLEDPRSDNADSALAGLIDRFRKDGPEVILPHRDRFRKLLTDRDPGVRRIAAWALARMGDLAMMPPLIEALKDNDDGVVTETRLGLQLLSRKLDGFGPPEPSTPEQRVAAAKAWKTWYEAVRPLKFDDGAPQVRKLPKADEGGKK
jgi:hypothetical protein